VTPASPPVEQSAVPLVGREHQLATLLDLVQSSRVGRRAMVGILEGDPGIGKSRLLEEVLSRVRLDGGTVAAVRMVEADLSESWGGLLALSRGGLLRAGGLPGAPAPALAAFAALVPEWAERFPGVPAHSESWPLGRAFSEAVRAAADEQPLVLAIDDAQWLDHDSFLALGALARDLARHPLVIMLAVEAVPPRPELDDLKARLGHDLPGKIVPLSRLNAEDLRHMARWALPGYSDVEIERLARRVGTDAAGLPLLVVELLRAVAAGLDLRACQGAWPEPFHTLTQTLPGDLPDAVVAAIRVGFRRMSPAAQRVLSGAAVLGDRVAVAALEKGSELEGAALDAALDELEWHHWLSHEPRGYSFVARIVREVIARDMMTAGQRQRVLERAGPAAGLSPPT
jgi:predicted ATPase